LAIGIFFFGAVLAFLAGRFYDFFLALAIVVGF